MTKEQTKYWHPQTWLIIGLLLALVQSQPSIAYEANIDSSTSKLVLGPSLEYLNDNEEIYHISQLAFDGDSLNWTGSDEGIRSYILEPGLYWFRVKLINSDNVDKRLMLEIPYPNISIADLYSIDANDEVKVLYADVGRASAFENRPLLHRNIINEVSIPAGSSMTFIWRIKSTPTFNFNVIAWDPQEFYRKDQNVQMLQGMVYGSLLVMLLYNSFVFLSTRQNSYIYYVLYLMTAGYMIAADEGHIYQYIAADISWSKWVLYSIVYAANLLLFAAFTIHFLNLKKYSARMVKGIYISAIVASVCILSLSAIESRLLLVVGLFFASLLYIFALLAGVRVRMRGVISAGHFVIAIMILAFALISSNMASMGLIFSSQVVASLPGIGTTLMMVFFSLALADRINQLQKENIEIIDSASHATDDREKANLELLRLQKEQVNLEQLTHQAQLESKAKSDFLATMSHEIRTPMNGVLGMTELLKSTRLDSNQTRYLNTIEQSGNALLSIINDLQDYSKIEAGQMVLDLSSFNLENLIDDCVSTFALRASEKNLNFIADIEPGTPQVFSGDKTKLRQIILNLLSNAFKFTDSGEVVLKVESTSKDAVNFAELKFSIIDTGIGLTPQEQQRLFTPFQHADDSTYGRYGGSGLGLAISKQLAELMDGHIGLSSEAGQGSTFWFTARLMIDEKPDQALLNQRSPLLENKKLLLVSASETSNTIITRLLGSWGLEVSTATDMEQANFALGQFDSMEHHFDLVVADYLVDGKEALELGEGLSKHTKLIIMSDGHEQIDHQKLSDMDVDIIIDKPITLALLHDSLVQAINPQSAEDEIESPEATTSDAQLSELNVLVVDDNKVNQMVITGLLNKLGISPDTAESGLDAISLCDNKNYQLILMDCEMPQMDGYEATKQIRNQEKLGSKPRTVIIALSAHAKSDHQEKAIASGMDSFLSKPVTLGELKHRMKSLFADISTS